MEKIRRLAAPQLSNNSAGNRLLKENNVCYYQVLNYTTDYNVSQYDKIAEFLISAPKANTMLLIVISKVYFSAKCNLYGSGS